MNNKLIGIENTKKECPYCFKKLSKIIKRKTKCKFCKKPIYVRTRPSDMKKILIKETEIKKVEIEWINYIVDSYWFKELEKLGTKKENVIQMYYNLKERFGTTPLIADVMWGIFNKAYLNAIKEGNRKSMDTIEKLRNKFKDAETRGEKIWEF